MFLCQVCQPQTSAGGDVDDASLSSSKAPTGKGFHAFTRYMLSNDACGFCRVELGEGRGSFAREIFASANGARSRLVYDGIIVVTGLNYVTMYLFPSDMNVRDTLWKSIRTPLAESVTAQQDTVAMKSKGKRAIQLGVSEHSNIHARDLSLLHQTEESNHPYGLDALPSDAVLLPQESSSRLDYSMSDFYQDSNLGRSMVAAPETSRPSFGHVFGRPSPVNLVDDPGRRTPSVSRKSSEKSDMEASNMGPPPAVDPQTRNPLATTAPPAAQINDPSDADQSVARIIEQRSMSPIFANDSSRLEVASAVSRSPFANLFDSNDAHRANEATNDDDNATESTMDDDEMRRVALQNDSELVDSLVADPAAVDVSAADSIPLLNQSSDLSLLSQPLSQPEQPPISLSFLTGSPMEKKFKALPAHVQRVLHRVVDPQELTVPQGVEQIVQWVLELKLKAAQPTANKKASSSKAGAKSDKEKTSSSGAKVLDTLQRIFSLAAVVHKGKLGSDGKYIARVCRVCLMEIYLVFSVGRLLLSDVALVPKSDRSSCRKLLSSTTSNALSRLNLAVGSPSISQLQLRAAFDGIFPHDVVDIVKRYTTVDVAVLLSPPPLSSNLVMQVVVDDLRKHYDARHYGDLWKLVGPDVATYDAASKSLSPTPQKAPMPSLIMEPLHQQQATSNAAAAAVGQALQELADDVPAGGAASAPEAEAPPVRTMTRVFSMSSALAMVNSSNGNGNGNCSNGVGNSSMPAPSAAAASAAVPATGGATMATAGASSLAAVPVAGGGGSTLVRTNTLISGKQHMSYHSSRRTKTVVVPVSSSAGTSLNGAAATANGSTGLPGRGAAVPAVAAAATMAPNAMAGAGPGRQPLTRSHSTVSQLQFSFQSSAANGASGQSLLGNVVSAMNGSSSSTAAPAAAVVGAGGIALGGLAAKLRAAAPLAATSTASSGLPPTGNASATSAAALAADSLLLMPTNATRSLKRSRSMQPSERKHILASPSPKRRRSTATTTAMDSLHDIGSVMTPVLGPAAEREPNHGETIDFDESYRSPIDPPPGLFGDELSHRTPEQLHRSTRHRPAQPQQQPAAGASSFLAKDAKSKLHSPVASLRSSLY
eukprot:gene1724-1246_t